VTNSEKIRGKKFRKKKNYRNQEKNRRKSVKQNQETIIWKEED